MSDCLFCNIVSGKIPGEIIYQDEKILVFNDIYPKAETHLLVIPKKHFIDLDDMAEKDTETLNYLINMIPEIVKQQKLTNGYRTIINTGKGGGQVIFHLHVHILAGKNLPGF